LTTLVKLEVQGQKWCGRSYIGGLFCFSRSSAYQWLRIVPLF
jgi:hypothetical protein